MCQIEINKLEKVLSDLQTVTTTQVTKDHNKARAIRQATPSNGVAKVLNEKKALHFINTSVKNNYLEASNYVLNKNCINLIKKLIILLETGRFSRVIFSQMNFRRKNSF